MPLFLAVFSRLKRWQRRLLGVLLTLGIGIALGLWQPYTPQIPAPQLAFTDIQGKSQALAGWRGKPVIVTFWATDCPSCVQEIPHFIELYQDYHAKGLEIIAIAMYHDVPSHVVEMTRLKQIPYTVSLDIDASHEKAFGRILATPTTFLITPAGFIDKEIIGQFKATHVRTWLDGVLQANSAATPKV